MCMWLRPCAFPPPPLWLFLISVWMAYRWHKICFHHGKERHGDGTSSGLMFLSPDLIFIFVSVVCLLPYHKHHCIFVVNMESIEVVVSYFFASFCVCLTFLLLLSAVATAWSGCSNRKCCPSSPIPCCRAQIAFVRCFHLNSTMIHCAKRKRKVHECHLAQA